MPAESEDHEVFSIVTGGRAPSFSRLGYGGNRSPELAEGNGSGAKLPRRQVAEKTSPGVSERKKRLRGPYSFHVNSFMLPSGGRMG